MGKSISNLYSYAEVSKACNQRFLDAMVDIVPVKFALDEIRIICSRKKVDGKTVTGFNVWSPEAVYGNTRSQILAGSEFSGPFSLR